MIKKSRIMIYFSSLTDTLLDRRSPAPISVENGPVAHSARALLRTLLYLISHDLVLVILDEILQPGLGLASGSTFSPDPRTDKAVVTVARGNDELSFDSLNVRTSSFCLW